MNAVLQIESSRKNVGGEKKMDLVKEDQVVGGAMGGVLNKERLSGGRAVSFEVMEMQESGASAAGGVSNGTQEMVKETPDDVISSSGVRERKTKGTK